MAPPSWLSTLVWTEYRLAVVFFVVVPLILLVWTFIQRFPALERLLIIYWRVSSLLAITVYLMMAALPVSFLTAFGVLILIPLSLWYWVDINEELADRSGWLAGVANVWRWAATLLAGLGALIQIPFLGCAFKSTGALLETAQCRVWLEPPWGFKALFHANIPIRTLGFWGLVALVVYGFCLAYFLLVRLGRQGRAALNP
ncbi:MAG: DUF3177 family protein [Gloeomargaritaceae cyanobacterium C42_A2020_066]|nr:DUF3177 family protein [Gloeomargaritaceae cyanobacterium C42_A2020_066]